LNGPSAFGGDEPEVVTSAHVGDEGDLFAVGRPGGAADLASHVEFFDGQAFGFDLSVGLGGDLFGIGYSLGRWKSLGWQVFCDDSAHEYDDSKERE
jgi:hypothetical protein